MILIKNYKLKTIIIIFFIRKIKIDLDKYLLFNLNK